MAEPVILFVYDNADRAAAGSSYQSEAARLGFRALSADWKRIQPAASGVVILEGQEAFATGPPRPVTDEHFHPDVLVHRKLIYEQSKDLMSQIWNSDRPLCSYHPLWNRIGDKWIFEACFRKAARRGVMVPRPRTYLIEKQDIRRALFHIGQSRPLIFKPSGSSLCEGIVLSSPADFSSVADVVSRSKWERYVVQDLVENNLLYRGRRFDLRVYALVTSFDPLRYKVLREGVVRLAARESDPATPADPLAVLTGSAYRCRQGVSADNLSISDLLRCLGRDGLDISRFWDDAEHLLGKVFTALFCSGVVATPDGLSGRFYLAGTDLMMISTGGGMSRPLLNFSDGSVERVYATLATATPRPRC